jgi:hypothetical protein
MMSTVRPLAPRILNLPAVVALADAFDALLPYGPRHGPSRKATIIEAHVANRSTNG